MPLLRFAEYKPDISDYEGSSTKNILNVVPQADGYGPFPDFAALAQTLPGACRGAFYALNSDGTVSIFAATATKLYQLNNTNYSWTDVSLGGGSYAALSSTAQWQFAQTANLVFATQANAVLQVFTVGTSTAFSNALGSPPQAAYMAVVGQFLVLSGLLSQPFRIQWSGLASFNGASSWTSGINSSDFNDFPDGGVVRGVAGGEQSGIVFQDQIIRSMRYVVGSPVIFQIAKVTQGLGLLAPYSLVQSGGSILFYSSKGFHIIAPGGQATPIGRERVDRTFFADLDISNMQLFMAAADPRSTRVLFAYKSTSGVTGQYDKLLGYDVLLDKWFPVKASGQYLLGLSQSGITLEALDAISGSIDAMTLSLDAYPTSVQPRLSQFNGAGVLGSFSAAPLEAIIQTAEQGTDFERLDITGFMPITDAKAVLGSIVYRDTQQSTPVQGAAVGLSRIGRCDMMRDTRYARFQIDIPAGSTWTYAAGVIPDANPGARQ